MLYQLSYSRLACWPMQFTLAMHAVNTSKRPAPAMSPDAYLVLKASHILEARQVLDIHRQRPERAQINLCIVEEKSHQQIGLLRELNPGPLAP